MLTNIQILWLKDSTSQNNTGILEKKDGSIQIWFCDQISTNQIAVMVKFWKCK